MLRFADELLLLLIDDKRGDLIPIPQWSLACALAGSVLASVVVGGTLSTFRLAVQNAVRSGWWAPRRRPCSSAGC